MLPSPTLDDNNVSRSGRIRKKSSKLADFQSPDEGVRQRRISKKGDEDLVNFSTSIFDTGDTGSMSDSDMDLPQLSEQDLHMDIDSLDLRLEDLEDLADLEDEEFSSDSPQAPPRAEIVKKPANLPVLQDKRPAANARITAFLLWAKHAKPDVQRDNPGLGASDMAVKLAEMWQTSPQQEKQAWSIKARRLALKSGSPLKSVGKPEELRYNTPPTSAAGRSSLLGGLQSPLNSSLLSPAEPLGPPNVYRVGDTQPVNVAAHLRLLGESLQVIGERLTEHNGVIAVSGSLSVLLDSILCAVGPLLCLTQRVPELNGADPAVLHQILDNVAYIMPGL